MAVALKVFSCAAGESATYWALLERGNKVFAVPLRHFFTFKRERTDNSSVDEALKAQEEAKKRAERVDVSFRKKFGIRDEDGGMLCYITVELCSLEAGHEKCDLQAVKMNWMLTQQKLA
jgi:hypothetical protein